MSNDRTTIGLSEVAFRILADLERAGWFDTQLAAFQAAVSLALALKLPVPDRSELTKVETKFNIGSLDPRLRELILQFGGSESGRPFEAAPLLAEAGLRHIERAQQSDLRWSEVLGLAGSRDQ